MKSVTDTIMAELMTPSRDFLASLTRRYAILIYDNERYAFAEAGDIRSIVIDQGRLLIDDLEIPAARFGPDFVSFCAEDSNSRLSGIINFTPDGQAISGTVYQSAQSGATNTLFVAGAAPATTYNTEIGTTGSTPPGTSDRFPDWSPAAPLQWQKSLTFTQSYTFNDGQLPTPIYEINGQDVTIYSAITINPASGNSLVSISIPPSILTEYIEELGENSPASFIVEISESGTNFQGCAQKAVRSTTGDYTPSSEFFQFRGAWNQAASATVDNNAVPVLASTMGKDLVATPTGAALGVTQLYTMQVDPKELQQSQFHELTENMKWALGNDPTKSNLLNFFGELPPDLPTSRTDIISKDLDFYTNQMAISYLGGPINKMQGPGEPSTRLTKDQETDLSFYLQAGLPKHPGFTRQTNSIFLTAFTETADGLSAYIEDQEANTINGKIDPAHDWGAQLYNELTKPVQLNLTYNGVAQGFGLANFNRHTALLMVLDSSGTYAKNYHKAFLSRTLGASITHLDLSSKTATTKWLTLAINAIISKSKTIPGIDADTQKQLDQLRDELSDAAEKLGGASALASALADLVVAAGLAHGSNDFWAVLQAAQAGWAKAGYVFARSIFVMAIIGGLVASIVAFFDWGKLSQEAQGQAVTSAVESAAKVIGTIKEIWSGEWGFTQSGQLDQSFSDIGLTEPLLGGMENVGDAAEQLTDTLKSGNLSDSTWGEIFTSFDGVISVIGAAAAAVICVLSTITFVKDILNHVSVDTTVLDGIMAAANIGVAIAGVVVFFSASTAVPILGAIAAVIGLIATLIELLLPKPKPETPAELFMDNNLLPAMTGPGAWIKPSPPSWERGQPVPLDNAYSREAA